jgi:hypothetical protein
MVAEIAALRSVWIISKTAQLAGRLAESAGGDPDPLPLLLIHDIDRSNRPACVSIRTRINERKSCRNNAEATACREQDA